MTGVQTCALPIFKKLGVESVSRAAGSSLAVSDWRAAGRPAGGRGSGSVRGITEFAEGAVQP